MPRFDRFCPWFPYAERIVCRLQVTWPMRKNVSSSEVLFTAPKDGARATSEELSVNDPFDRLDSDDDGGDLGVLPDERLPAGTLQLSLRLAASFGDGNEFRRCLEPGAITLLGGMNPEDVRALTEILWLGFLPPGLRLSLEPSRSAVDSYDLLIVRPEAQEKEVSQHARKRFHKDIADALGTQLPMIVLCPHEATPPATLGRYLPAPRRLVPVNRATILEHLRLEYPGSGMNPDMVHAALPEDRRLVGLSLVALHVALRAPGPLAAAQKLTELLQVPDENSGPRLTDFVGDHLAFTWARQMVADLVLWRQGDLPWSDLCRSLLLFGQPGTGKTWLARAMGNSAGVNFVVASFAQWQAVGHLGDMLRAMQGSFAEARRLSPAILFIDEIDAVGSREDGDRHGSNYRAQVINGFLEEMGSISEEEGVIVIGACNHPDRIDPAVLRAGRFDLKVEVPLPDTAALVGILRYHLGGAFCEEDMLGLARQASGTSAADVDAAVRKARAAARSAGRELRLEDLKAQFTGGGVAGDLWVWRAAVHECAHAIVGTLLGACEVVRVLLTQSGGLTLRRRSQQVGLVEDLEAELAYHLAGRAAEKLLLGEPSAGSGGPTQSDLAQATHLAMSIDSLLGLGALGPIWDDTPPNKLLRDPELRARVRARLEAAEERAKLILAAHRQHLEAMAEALTKERELAGESLLAWLAPFRTILSEAP